MDCKGISALACGASPPPSFSLTLLCAGLVLSHFFSNFFHSCFTAVFCPFLNMLSQRYHQLMVLSFGQQCFGNSWNWFCPTWAAPYLFSQRPALQFPFTLPKPFHVNPIQHYVIALKNTNITCLTEVHCIFAFTFTQSDCNLMNMQSGLFERMFPMEAAHCYSIWPLLSWQALCQFSFPHTDCGQGNCPSVTYAVCMLAQTFQSVTLYKSYCSDFLTFICDFVKIYLKFAGLR